jgi:hypothetical protein
MRVPAALVLACLAIFAVAGCGKTEASTPVACLEGADAYVSALAKAPGAVRLGGETPISECLTENQDGGDLANVGGAMVEAATALNVEARVDPGGEAALELGYLLGAVEHGAGSTEGIHTDLVRRLAVAARYAPGKDPLSPAFLHAYKQGFDAGHTNG